VDLYHATTGLRAIRREGFRTRRELGAAALGGGPSTAVSLTIDFRVAASIALGLRVLSLGARRDLSLRDLLDFAAVETPKALRAIQAGAKRDYGLDDETIARLDDGWVLERTPGMLSGRRLPPGALPGQPYFMGRRDVSGHPLEYVSWWIRGPAATEEWAVRSWQGNEPFYNLYQLILAHGEGEKECFNPLFFGTDLASLGRVSADDIGVLAVQADIPRVCPDVPGTVGLGYLDERLARYWAGWLNDTFGYDCPQDLSCLAEHGKPFRSTRRSILDYPGPAKPEIGPWRVLDEGERRPQDTMAYLSSLAEFRVYDPRRIRVLEATSILELQRSSRWGGRATYPYFRPGEDLVGLRPGTRVLAGAVA
jgi:hypothetical protein